MRRFLSITIVVLAGCAALPAEPEAEARVEALNPWLRSTLITGNQPLVTQVIACTSVGSPCCDADASVPTRHCLDGLGCNVATNRCEECGAPGEVCCDGPLTSFSGRSYTGIFIDPETGELDPDAMESCYQPGSCDTRLVGGQWTGPRICRGCGDRAGGACCPPDVRYALARCSGVDRSTGARLTCNDPWWETGAGTCVPCGQPGMPSCSEGELCDEGTTDVDGICVPCGYIGQPSCDGDCLRGANSRNGVCVACGAEGQSPCDLGGCHQNLVVRNRVCVSAGGLGQPCQDDPEMECGYGNLYCDAQRTCQPCGGPNMPSCPTGNPCNVGTNYYPSRRNPAGTLGLCTPCGTSVAGGPESECCFSTPRVEGWWRADEVTEVGQCSISTMFCGRRGRCVSSAGGGGGGGGSHGEPPRTCGGNLMDFGVTATYYLPVRVLGGPCLAMHEYVANSRAEAVGCAVADHGAYNVITTDSVSETYALTDDYGCHSVGVIAVDSDEAEECAQLHCVNCNIAPGLCQ